MNVLADIESGNVDLADVAFLVAFILCLIGAVIYGVGRAWAAAMVAGGVAAIALGLLVL